MWYSAPTVKPAMPRMPQSLLSSRYMCAAWPIERIFVAQTACRPEARAFSSEGSRMLISKAMIATTTSNSIRVKAPRVLFRDVIRRYLGEFRLSAFVALHATLLAERFRRANVWKNSLAFTAFESSMSVLLPALDALHREHA